MTDSASADDWCTIESDPGVFTELLSTVGCTGVELQELWSLDDDSLLQLEQGTGHVYGLIFLFQWIGQQQQDHAASKEPIPEDDIPPHLFFAHQITTNACATQAMLSVVLNALHDPAELGPTLAEFQSFTKDFPPHLKGMAVSSSEVIKKAHNSFARQDGFLAMDKKMRRVMADEDNEAFHFVAYVPVDGIVYELDGLQKGPIIVGAYNDEAAAGAADTPQQPSDWLVQARGAIQERMAISGAQNVKFNLMAVIQDKRILLQQQLSASDGDINAGHDMESVALQLAAEDAKRDAWHKENQRRRHNYLGFCVQLIKELAAAGMLPQLVEDAKKRQAEKRRNKNNSKA